MVMGFQGAVSQTSFQTGVVCLQDVDDDYLAYLLVPGIATSVTFLGTELSLQVIGRYDLLNMYIWKFPWRPPGYEDFLWGSWGGFVLSRLSIPLLKVRGGLWNPGLYFGDIYFVPFLDFAFNDIWDPQLAYGGTFHLELKAGALYDGVPLDLYAIFGITLDGNPIFKIDLVFHGQSGGYARSNFGGRDMQAAVRR
jgi:hypothetical protein